ncbi:MAG: efflux RND transporter permease subunit [Campylobacterales bacterium]|nr:efflux RND transporter permease subunit [Campylobacterales bacterium]
MKFLIEFFLSRPRLNYVLFLFLFVAGIFSYNTMPKEIFPPMNTDKISISGGYLGTSPNTLDKMAVTAIEDNVNNISGISKTTSVITSNIFHIILELSDGEDKDDILEKVKDAVTKSKSNFPSDMDEPTVASVNPSIPLILVNIASSKESYDLLTDIAKDFKNRLSQIKNLKDLEIYGEGEKEFSITLNTEKIKAYGISPSMVISSIKSLSSIFPLGKIEQKGGKHFFVSTFNGVKKAEEFLHTLIKVGGKGIYLKDIATIEKKYSQADSYASFNGERTITINIAKAIEGNSMVLTKRIKKEVEKLQKEYPNISIGTFSDTSVYIRNRLNTVVSNIMFGLILVGFVMYLLINKRISFVVILGIPTSFVISLIFLDYGGYSINMMTLLGALIAIGVIVDDAIIVAENIQRHLEEGKDIKEAALVGTKEVIAPVLTASVTTVFAFLPMLILSGEMGEFIKLIPIAITVLILASVIESFVFLPMHAKHILDPKEKEVSWEPVMVWYKKIITKLIHYRKTTVVLFWVVVPFLIVVGFATTKFQLFPVFDGDQMNVSCKLPVNTSIEETYEVIKDLEQKILSVKEKYDIDTVTAIAGFRMDTKGHGETRSNLFHIFVDLHKAKPDNFVAKYITPYLSFDYDEEGRIRDIKSYEIEVKLREELEEFMKKYPVEEFEVQGPNAGVVKVPIEIAIVSDNEEQTHKAIKKLKDGLNSIKGTISVTDDAKLGIAEIKLKVNSYGQMLGVTEQTIAGTISGYFLGNSVSKSLDESGIVEIKIEDRNKDFFQTLKNFQIPLSDGSEVSVFDVADFVEIRNYEKITKVNGKQRSSVFSDIIKTTGVTAGEVLKKLEPTIEELRKEGVEITFGGEKEKNQQMAQEMGAASLVAVFLIFITLLVMFDSFRYSLIVLSVVPLSLLGVVIGHVFMGLDMSMPSIIGALGLAGVVINDGIIMLDFIRRTKTSDELLERAKLRLRPIVLTSITTLVGLSTLIFFPSGQAVILQPLAVSLGFGLFWGTILNLFYIPTLYAVVTHTKEEKIG